MYREPTPTLDETPLDGTRPRTEREATSAADGDSTADIRRSAIHKRRRRRLVLHLAAQRRPRGGRRGGRGGSGGSSDKGFLDDDQLRAIETEYADGITAVQVVEIFMGRGLRFSEATFRKYVQQGLLPRSRRVGRKGKHRGSLGVYPARTVRRVNAIKRLMADGFTIEEIQEQFLRYTDVIERLEEGIDDVFKLLDTDAAAPRFDARARKDIQREIKEARKSADELLRRLDGLSKRVAKPADDHYRTAGAAGSAEDLL